MGKTLTIFDLDNTLIKGDSEYAVEPLYGARRWVNDAGYSAGGDADGRITIAAEMNIADYGNSDSARAGLVCARQDVDALLARCVP